MLELYFFNVGHGDSIAIKFPNNEWGIIDCNRNINHKEPNVLTFLKSKNVKHLNFLCITHKHEDHFKGVDVLVDYFKDNIDTLILPNKTISGKYTRNRLIPLKKAIATIIVPNKGKKLKCADICSSFIIDEVSVQILSPDDEISNECFSKFLTNSEEEVLNKESVVIYFEFAGKKILLTGDVTADVWDKILHSDAEIKADIIKISHHGSKENNPYNILKLITKPNSYAIISSDGNIKYKALPSRDLIAFLQDECKINVLTTYDINQYQKDEKPKNIENLKENSIINFVSKSLTKDSQIYSGYIKITIDKQGNITSKIYPNLEI